MPCRGEVSCTVVASGEVVTPRPGEVCMRCRGTVVFSVLVSIFLVMVWIPFCGRGNNALSLVFVVPSRPILNLPETAVTRNVFNS